MAQRHNKLNYHNEKGQILLIVIFIITIALSAGIMMSNRFISGLRARTDLDDSAKAISIAEAAIEKVLLIPTDTLKSYAQNNTCGTNCHLEVTDENGQVIFADVELSLEGQNITDSYPVSLVTNQSVEVSLAGYASGQNVYVCWNTDASIEATYYYSSSSVTLARSYAYNSITSVHSENNYDTASSLFGYSSCATVSASNTPLALRIKPYYMETDVYIVPEAGYSLPIQGVQLKSTGQAGVTRRIVTVVKTNSYVPTVFDYVLYQKSETDPLSN